MELLDRAFRKTKENAKAVAADMVQRQAPRTREKRYKAGEMVWVSDPAAHAGGKRKLWMPFKGPGVIVQAYDTEDDAVVYKVRMPNGKEANLHHNRLKPFKERTEESSGQASEPATGASGKEDGRPKGQANVETQQGGALLPEKIVWDMISWWENNQNQNDPEGLYKTRSGRQVRPVSRYQAGQQN